LDGRAAELQRNFVCGTAPARVWQRDRFGKSAVARLLGEPSAVVEDEDEDEDEEQRTTLTERPLQRASSKAAVPNERAASGEFD